jgi:hypothetical protein
MRNLSDTSVRKKDKKNREMEKRNVNELDAPLVPGWNTNRR